MKKYLAHLIITLALYSGSVLAAEEQIVRAGNAVQFGLWKVYNSGDEIIFIDKEASHFVLNSFFTNPPDFFTEENLIFLSSAGTASFREPDFAEAHIQPVKAAVEAEIESQLQDGRYRLGVKRYVVNGDTVTIFNSGDEDAQGVAIPTTVLKKFSNGMVFNGFDISTVIDPTVILDADATPAPAKIMGDCLASYSPETGRVEIPCLSIKGDTTVFHVGQQQIPGTFTFQVGPNDVTPVQ